MRGGFAPRLAIEAGFLILVGVGAGLADLRAVVIVALLAGSWLLVSLLEVAVWRGQARVAGTPLQPVPLADPDSGAPPLRTAAGERAEPAADDAYPLRADAGSTPSAEVEAYTRVLDTE
jgi:hypothetical protein